VAKTMNFFKIAVLISLSALHTVAQPLDPNKIVSKAPTKKLKFGDGLYRVSYITVQNCKVEFQSFDSTITDKKLDMLVSFMYHIGGKERGMENEFKTYRSYDFTNRSETKDMLVAYSAQQIKDFEKSVEKLKTAPIPKEFEAMKKEMLRNHTKRLEFEKICTKWYASGNDAEFRKEIISFYTDIYIIATLDKTLALKDQVDKWKYSYAELYDIVFANMFTYDKLNEIQNKIMWDYQIEVVLEPHCPTKKS
jgi:hypothetical protein